MSVVRKYTFDTEFDAAGAVVRAPKPKKKYYKPEDVEAARAEARAEGEASALAAAERDTAAAVAAVAERLDALIGRLDAESRALRREAVDLALAAAKTAAGAALARFPEEAVISLFSELADHLRQAPRVEVEARADADAVRRRLEDAGAARPGALVVAACDDGAPGDVRIVWEDGLAARRAEDALAAIREAAQRWLVTTAAEAGRADDGGAEAATLSLFDAGELEDPDADG